MIFQLTKCYALYKCVCSLLPLFNFKVETICFSMVSWVQLKKLRQCVDVICNFIPVFELLVYIKQFKEINASDPDLIKIFGFNKCLILCCDFVFTFMI